MSPHCDCVEFRNNFGSSLLSANPCRLDQIPPIPVTCSQPSTQGDVWLIASLCACAALLLGCHAGSRGTQSIEVKEPGAPSSRTQAAAGL